MTITSKMIADCDQGNEALLELLPPFWRRLYLRCVGEGFTETQALSLVKTHILTNASHGPEV